MSLLITAGLVQCVAGGGVGVGGLWEGRGVCVCGGGLYVLCNMSCTHVSMSSLFQSRIGHKGVADPRALDSRRPEAGEDKRKGAEYGDLKVVGSNPTRDQPFIFFFRRPLGVP